MYKGKEKNYFEAEDVNDIGERRQDCGEGISAEGDIAISDQQMREVTHSEERVNESQLAYKDEGRGTHERDELVQKYRGKRRRRCVKKKLFRKNEEWSSSCSTSSGDACSVKTSPKKKRLSQNFDANHFVMLRGKEWQGVHQDPTYVTAKPHSESGQLEVQSEPSTPELIAEMCAASPAHSPQILSTEGKLNKNEDDVHTKENKGKSLPETSSSNIETREAPRTINPSCLTLWRGNVNPGAYEGNPFISVNPNLEEHSLGKSGTCRTHSQRNTNHSNYHSLLDEEIELLEKLYDKFEDILERTKKRIEYLKKHRQRQQMEHNMGPGRGGAGEDFGKRKENQDGEDVSDREPCSGSTGVPFMQFSTGSSQNVERRYTQHCFAHSQPEMCLTYGVTGRHPVPGVNPVTHFLKSCKGKKLKMSQGSRGFENLQAFSSLNSFEYSDRNTDPQEGLQLNNPYGTTLNLDEEEQLFDRKEWRGTIKHRDKAILSTFQQCQKSPRNKSVELQWETVEKEHDSKYDKRKEHRSREVIPMQEENLVLPESSVVMIGEPVKSICEAEQDSKQEQVIFSRGVSSSSQINYSKNCSHKTMVLSTTQPKEGIQDIRSVCSHVSDPGHERTQTSNQCTNCSSLDTKNESFSQKKILSEEFASCVHDEMVSNSQSPVKYLPSVENSAKAADLTNLVKPCGFSYKREQIGQRKAYIMNNLYNLQSSHVQSKDEGIISKASYSENLADKVERSPRQISLSRKDMMEMIFRGGEESSDEPKLSGMKMLQSKENIENDPPVQAVSSEAESEYFTPHSSPASSAIVVPRSAVVCNDVEASSEKFFSSQQQMLKTLLQYTYPCNVSVKKKMSIKFGQETYDIYR